MGGLIGNVVGAAFLVILLAGIFGFAVSLGVAFEDSGGGLPGLWRRGSAVALAISAIVLVYVAALPFAVPFTGEPLQTTLRFSWLAVTLGGAYMVARQLRPGWSVMAAVALVVVSVWVTGLSALRAYESGWHGLNIRDVSGIDQGDGFEIGLAMAFGTVLGPAGGIIAGMLGSRRSKGSGPGAASA